MAMGESRRCGCSSVAGFCSSRGFAWLGSLAASLGVHGLDGKDEVDRAGSNLEALFSECLVGVGVGRGTVV